jgi:tetratricopeptide (TPR) repeat protein
VPAPSPPSEEASPSGVGASGRRAPLHAAGPGAPEFSGRGHSYEQLVADGDRALENGNTVKAQKMFDEALRLQPDGVAAVTGSGYLLLDRQKPLAAIGMFKRALASAPSFPQALFGLGEAYRSEGNPSEAIDAYRRYLAAAPGGPDAPAARRQIRELESAAAPARHAVTSPPEGTAPSPVAP